MSRRFRKWVEEYQDQAWTLARYLLKDPSEAEDACQEAFVKLWRNQESIDPDKVRPWLMKVTRNGCLDRLEAQAPDGRVAGVAPAGRGSGPDAGYASAGTGARLKDTINGLKEPYRSLVVLRDVHQHSYEEVGAVLELNLPQVKTYLHRARKQLRQQLAEVRP